MSSDTPFDSFMKSSVVDRLSTNNMYRLVKSLQNDDTREDTLGSTIMVDELEDIINGYVWGKTYTSSGYIRTLFKPVDKACTFRLADSREKKIYPVGVKYATLDPVNGVLVIDCMDIKVVRS